MSSYEGTPTPWRYIKSENSLCILGYDTPEHDVIIVKTIRDEVSDKTWNRQKIDHQLIVAAPEMLKALIETRKFYDRLPAEWFPEAIVARLTNVIEKARTKDLTNE